MGFIKMNQQVHCIEHRRTLFVFDYHGVGIIAAGGALDCFFSINVTDAVDLHALIDQGVKIAQRTNFDTRIFIDRSDNIA